MTKRSCQAAHTGRNYPRRLRSVNATEAVSAPRDQRPTPTSTSSESRSKRQMTTQYAEIASPTKGLPAACQTTLLIPQTTNGGGPLVEANSDLGSRSFGNGDSSKSLSGSLANQTHTEKGPTANTKTVAKSSFQYVSYLLPETRVNAIAKSRQISRDLNEENALLEGQQEQDLKNLVAPHASLPPLMLQPQTPAARREHARLMRIAKRRAMYASRRNAKCSLVKSILGPTWDAMRTIARRSIPPKRALRLAYDENFPRTAPRQHLNAQEMPWDTHTDTPDSTEPQTTPELSPGSDTYIGGFNNGNSFNIRQSTDRESSNDRENVSPGRGNRSEEDDCRRQILSTQLNPDLPLLTTEPRPVEGLCHPCPQYENEIHHVCTHRRSPAGWTEIIRDSIPSSSNTSEEFENGPVSRDPRNGISAGRTPRAINTDDTFAGFRDLAAAVQRERAARNGTNGSGWHIHRNPTAQNLPAQHPPAQSLLARIPPPPALAPPPTRAQYELMLRAEASEELLRRRVSAVVVAAIRTKREMIDRLMEEDGGAHSGGIPNRGQGNDCLRAREIQAGRRDPGQTWAGRRLRSLDAAAFAADHHQVDGNNAVANAVNGGINDVAAAPAQDGHE